jgi:hypothetical protein
MGMIMILLIDCGILNGQEEKTSPVYERSLFRYLFADSSTDMVF